MRGDKPGVSCEGSHPVIPLSHYNYSPWEVPGPSHGGCPVRDYSQTPATPSQTEALTSVTEINIVTDKLGGKSDV